MATEDEKKAEEIEITPEMIEAGMDAYGDFDSDCGCLGGVLAEVFKAMCAKAGLVAVDPERFKHCS